MYGKIYDSNTNLVDYYNVHNRRKHENIVHKVRFTKNDESKGEKVQNEKQQEKEGEADDGFNPVQVYGLMKTSWKHQGKVFFEESTLHGVRYIAESGRPAIEKLMWFICVAVGAIATVVIIVSLWEKFQTNPTITGLDTDFHTWDVPFPAVTVCQHTPSNDSRIDEYIERVFPDSDHNGVTEFLLAVTKLSFATLTDFQGYTDSGVVPENTDLKKLAFELMNPCPMIFSECSFKAESFNCCDSFFPVFTESGFCYTFNSKHYERMDDSSEEPEIQYIKETDAKWSLKFQVHEGIDKKLDVYIHNSDESPGIDVIPQHTWDFRVDRILFSVKATYTTDDAHQLSIKQRHCVFQNEVKLKSDSIYTYTGCTKQCRMDRAMRMCGCIPHFYEFNLDGGHYVRCRLKQLSCIADRLKQITAIDGCKCNLGCSNTVYEVEKLNENTLTGDLQTALETEFVSWPMVRYKREVLFGWVDLLVSFGGIAGLFLGFSLLSGAEIIYYFTIRACCMVHEEKDELKKLQDEEEVAKKKKKNYDLSLVPKFVAKEKFSDGKSTFIKNHRELINFPSKMEPMRVRPLHRKPTKVVPPFGIDFVN